MVSTAAFHARVRGSVPGLGGLKETKLFLPHPRVKVSIVGSLRDREVASSASDRQGSNFESCVWRTVSSQSSHHPQEVLQFSLYVHKGGLKPDLFHLFHNHRNGQIAGWFNIWLCISAIVRQMTTINYYYKVALVNDVVVISENCWNRIWRKIVCENPRVCRDLDLVTYYPANTNHLYNIYTMSAQRLRRWSNIV